jgi:GNAT superfamily N-acetyltransferase
MPSLPEPLPVADPTGQADADARHIWALATGLGDNASPQRTSAYVSLLLEHVDADIDRLNAAATVCASQHEPGQDDGYVEAIQLIDHARGRLTAAHADTDPDARQQVRDELHAQWHPEPTPYEWDHARRRRPSWWLRNLTARRVKISHRPARSPAGVQRLSAQLGGRPTGRMLYQICNECRVVLIGKITTDAAYQGLGIGTRLVLNAFASHRSYAWHTTPQSPTSGTFWTKMAKRTNAAFTETRPCIHMTRDLPLG